LIFQGMSLQEMGNGQLWILMLNLLLFWLLGDQINIKSYLCLVYIKVCFEIFLSKKIPKNPDDKHWSTGSSMPRSTINKRLQTTK